MAPCGFWFVLFQDHVFLADLSHHWFLGSHAWLLGRERLQVRCPWRGCSAPPLLQKGLPNHLTSTWGLGLPSGFSLIGIISQPQLCSHLEDLIETGRGRKKETGRGMCSVLWSLSSRLAEALMSHCPLPCSWKLIYPQLSLHPSIYPQPLLIFYHHDFLHSTFFFSLLQTAPSLR